VILFGEGSGSREEWLEAVFADKSILEIPSEEQQRLDERVNLGSAEFCDMMENFYVTDSDYEYKEFLVFDRIRVGVFASFQPEDWAELGKEIYLSATTPLN